MDDNIRDLINRLYSYQTQSLTDSDSLNLFDILLDCGEAAAALGKACDYIDNLPRISQWSTGAEIILPYENKLSSHILGGNSN